MSQVFRSMIVTTVLLVAASAAVAQSSACRDVRFSETVLSRFPRAPEACLDVITRDGQQYAVFRAKLDQVSGNTMRLRFTLPDGTRAAPMKITTKPERRVLIDGKPVPVPELAPNQELTAYVRVDRPLLALEPVTPTEPLEPMPLPAPEESQFVSAAPTMPHTSSPLHTVLLVGLLCLALALAGHMIEKMRK